MFRRGGIFSGFGAFDASSVMIPLDPSAGSGVPFTSMLQGYMKQQGANKLGVDGKWGQCSDSAFKNMFGVPPSYDSLNTLFAFDQFGIPPSNVNVWKSNGACYGGSDAYNPPPVEQQLAAPDPAFLLANLFGLPIPGGLCTGGRKPDMNAKKCLCPAGTVENLQTNNCDAFEQPGKLPPSTTQTKLGPAVSKYVPQKILPIVGTPGTSTPQPSKFLPLLSSVAFKTSGLLPVKSNGVTQVMPLPIAPGKFLLPQVAAGMSTGVKVAIGVAAVALLGGGAWLLLRKKPGQATVAEAIANFVLTPKQREYMALARAKHLYGDEQYMAIPGGEGSMYENRRRRRSRRRMRCNCYTANCGE